MNDGLSVQNKSAQPLDKKFRDSSNVNQLLDAYLSSQPLDSEFRDIQVIYTNWLDVQHGWYPSLSDSLRLDQIARGEGSRAGYATSLLHLLYDIAIPPTWRTTPPEATPRSLPSKDNKSNVV
ncbi:MAG: hypothetical protein K9I85_15305 [Saprospiraceae bacterium]|nr:hypothetical protein [Saprospiraceae bacterium]